MDDRDMEDLDEILHETAIQNLELALRRFIRHRPLSEYAEYDGHGGGHDRDDPNKFPISQKDRRPGREYFDDRQSSDIIYSRSWRQRYILQRLAADLNAHVEESRDLHSVGAFKEAMKTPLEPQYHLIQPNVKERDADDGLKKQKSMRAETSSHFGHVTEALPSPKNETLSGKPIQTHHHANPDVRERKRFTNTFPNLQSDHFFMYYH